LFILVLYGEIVDRLKGTLEKEPKKNKKTQTVKMKRTRTKPPRFLQQRKQETTHL